MKKRFTSTNSPTSVDARNAVVAARLARARRMIRPVIATLAASAVLASCGVGASSASDSSTSATENSATASEASSSSGSSEGSTGLGAVGTLDSATVHTVSLDFDDAAFATAIESYLADGSKEWIEATVTIDGTTFKKAGIRLKGNSTLKGVSASSDPATLPWLVKLDKYTEQDLDGLTELVIRSNSSTSALNEALALELLSEAGLASQDAIGVSLTVNGSKAVYRLVIDNPDDEWMAEELDASGALYKADAQGDYSYRGTDQEAYAEAFDQEAGKDNTDLAPLVEFLDFVNNSDDATFAAELDQHLDVDAFASYLAMETLLDNFDDIDGPGNNSYLYYDTESKKVTVVPWDHNLAYGLRPGGAGGGGVGPGGGQGGPPPGVGGGGGPAGGAGGGPNTKANTLVTRFNAVQEFEDLYNQKLEALRASLYTSGKAAEILAQWSDIVTSSGLVDDATVQSDASSITAKLK